MIIEKQIKVEYEHKRNKKEKNIHLNKNSIVKYDHQGDKFIFMVLL